MKTIVGLFDSASEANQVVSDLHAAGIARDSIALTGAGGPGADARAMVTVSADDAEAGQVTGIMNRHHAFDVNDRGIDVGSPAGGTGAGTGNRLDRKRDASYPESTPSFAAGSPANDAAGGTAVPVSPSGVSSANVDEFTTSGNSPGAAGSPGRRA